ncbi:MAG: hypothetical protein KJ060_19990, partial [Candidatus Hydrogenedentes bacterium]|nr:hypothetical protein [Candidatus Hydrogenedentota bacterium]
MSRAAYYGYYELRYSGTTEYAPDFHPIEWDLVRIGATIDKVYSQFGAPIWVAETTGEVVWIYNSPKRQVTLQRNYLGEMSRDSTEYRVTKSDVESQNLTGLTEEQVVEQLGKPDEVKPASTNRQLHYSAPRIASFGGEHFVQYVVEVDAQEKV